MRKAFSLAEVLIVVPLLAMVISTVIALRVGGHRAQVLSDDVERLQAAAHALARHAADEPFDALTAGPLPDAWVRDAGADPRLLKASVAPTADPDVVLFTAESTRSRVRCRRLVVRAEASLARSFPLEAR